MVWRQLAGLASRRVTTCAAVLEQLACARAIVELLGELHAALLVSCVTRSLEQLESLCSRSVVTQADQREAEGDGQEHQTEDERELLPWQLLVLARSRG